eukprot:2520018-Prymnesium_polylepis.1
MNDWWGGEHGHSTGMVCWVSHNLSFAPFRYTGAARYRFAPNREMREIAIRNSPKVWAYPHCIHTPEVKASWGRCPHTPAMCRALLGGSTSTVLSGETPSRALLNRSSYRETGRRRGLLGVPSCPPALPEWCKRKTQRFWTRGGAP